jgi:hypothetical protein
VVVLSLLSNATLVLGAATAGARRKPKFEAGVDTQPCTAEVTSVETYSFATETGTLLWKGAPRLGRVL